MELQLAVRGRRMVRSYDSQREVPVGVVTGLLELAVRAPSAGHTQGWQFLVLASADANERFWSATTSDGPDDPWLARLRKAPVLVLCLADKQAYLDRYAEPDKGWTDRAESRWPVPYWDVDTGMATMILLLAAHEAGLGACFFGIEPGRVEAILREFDLPQRLRPIGVVSLGYPAPDRRSPSLRRGRRPFADVVRVL
jgi:nitroreductase